MTRNIINWLRAAMCYNARNVSCKHMPIRLWVEPTSNCNLRCVMCPQREFTNEMKGFMELALFKKIVDDAKDFRPSINLFMRGESLLHPDIIQMICYAHDNGIVTRLETNAGLLNSDMAQKLLDSGLDFISFSFDGYDKETYESIRVNSNFERTMENIRYFLELKKRLGRKKPYTLLQVINLPTIIKTEKRQKEEFIEKFRGLTKFKFVTPHRFGGKIQEEKTGTRYAYTGIDKKVKYVPCPYPWTSMSIYWNGDVVPCCIDFHGNYVVGNVKKDSIRDIWNSERLKELRKKLAERKNNEFGLCSTCDFLWQDTFLGVSKKNIKDFVQFAKELNL